MIEQPRRNEEIEEFLKTSGLIPFVCQQINERLSKSARDENDLTCLPLNTSISYYNQKLSSSERVRNALEEPLDLALAGWKDNVVLLIDPDPQANSAHPCWVAVAELTKSRPPQIVEARYPPLETKDLRLVRYNFAAQILAA